MFFLVVNDTDLLSSSLFKLDFVFLSLLLLSLLALFICFNNSIFSSLFNFFLELLFLEKETEFVSFLAGELLSFNYFVFLFFV